MERVLDEPGLAERLIESSRERVDWADTARHDQVFQATLERLLAR